MPSKETREDILVSALNENRHEMFVENVSIDANPAAKRGRDAEAPQSTIRVEQDGRISSVSRNRPVGKPRVSFSLTEEDSQSIFAAQRRIMAGQEDSVHAAD